jgi:Zn ribbon nucleic-acid-binding protein
MDTSQIDITDYIPLSNLKKVATSRGGEWKGACPFCGGKDRLVVWPAENKWSCRHCVDTSLTPQDAIDYVRKRDNLTFIEAITKMGLASENGQSTTSKRAYKGMSDYATQHGLDAEDLAKFGWEEGFYSFDHQAKKWVEAENGRHALRFKTNGGYRYRFIDSDDPKSRYGHDTGYKYSWYLFSDRVIENAKKEHAPLVLCNGEISTAAARFWGVPAICVAGGGEKAIPDDLLAELNQRWDGRIAIIMDCDDTGRQAAAKIAKQLPNASVIDLKGIEGFDLADFVRLHMGDSLKEIKRMMPLPPQAPMTHKEAARQTIARLDIDNVMEGKPIYIPFKTWNAFGGYAEIGWPAKITAGVGMSGHGKTSWLNTMIDELLRQGEIGVGLMPEFEQDEYHWDRLQRYSGFDGYPLITADTMMKWELWKTERKQGKPEHLRKGKPLSNEQMKVIEEISAYVESWAGEFELFPFESRLETALERMGEAIQDRRSHGQYVSFAAFDYIQILKAESIEDNENSFETVLGLIKNFVMKHKIHGIVTSQVNKTADKANREGGKLLGTTDMRYVRDDKINLLVTLNLMYDELGERKKLPNGMYAGVANIAKNTKGRTGKVNMQVDFEHLCWLDETWSTEKHSTLDDSDSFDDRNL